MEKSNDFQRKLNDGSVLFLGTKGMMKVIDVFEGKILRWNLDTGKDELGSNLTIYSLAVSKKRRRIVSGNTNRLYIWQMDELGKFTPYPQSTRRANLIFCVDVEREREDLVASISCDEGVFIYKWNESKNSCNLEKMIETEVPPGSFGWGVVFTNPGHVAYCGSFEGVRDFDFVKEKTQILSDGENGTRNSYSLTYVRRRNCVAIGFKDLHRVHLYDMRSGKRVQNIRSGNDELIFSIMTTEDSRNLFIGTDHQPASLSNFDLRQTKRAIAVKKDAHAAGIPRIVEIECRRGSFVGTCSEYIHSFGAEFGDTSDHVASGMKIWKRENLQNVLSMGTQKYARNQENILQENNSFLKQNPWAGNSYAMAYWGDEGKVSMQARMDESERIEFMMKQKDDIQFMKLKWENGCGNRIEVEIWKSVWNGKINTK